MLLETQKRKSLAHFLICVLLLNLVSPAIAALDSSSEKVFLCSQNGYEWVSLSQQEQQYINLAKQLNLTENIELSELIPDLLEQPTEPQPHGKCALCLILQVDLVALNYSEITFYQTLLANQSKFLHQFHVYPENIENTAHPRAPPVFVQKGLYA